MNTENQGLLSRPRKKYVPDLSRNQQKIIPAGQPKFRFRKCRHAWEKHRENLPKKEEFIPHPVLSSAVGTAFLRGQPHVGEGPQTVYFPRQIDTIIAFASFLRESRKCGRRKVRSRRNFGGFPAGGFIFPDRAAWRPIAPKKPEKQDRTVFFVVLHKDPHAHNNEYSPTAAAVFMHRNMGYSKFITAKSSGKPARFEGSCIFLQKIVNMYSCCNFWDLVL